MQKLAQSGYTTQQVSDLLCAARGMLRRNWRFNILTRQGQTWRYKGDLTPFVTQAMVKHDSTQAVKRTLSLTIAESAAMGTVDINGTTITQAPLNYFSDWIQPVYRVGALDAAGTWLEYPLGLFQFTNPSALMTGYMLQRQAELADLTYTVSRAVATTAPSSPDNSSNNTPTWVNPVTIPPTDAAHGGRQIYLMDVICALLTNSPDGPPGGTGYDWHDPIMTLPGCGLRWEHLDQNFFGSYYWGIRPDCTGANTTASIDAVVPPGNFTINPGTSYLDTINQILYYLNCDQLWSTEGVICTSGQQIGPGAGTQYTRNGTHGAGNGPTLTSEKWPQYQNYSGADLNYAYSTEQGVNNVVPIKTVDKVATGAAAESITFNNSIVMAGTTDAINIDAAINVINLIIEDTGRDAYVATLTNIDPNSPLSTVSSGRRYSKVIQDNGIPANGLSSLQDFAKGIAFYEMQMASSAVETCTLLTGVNPCHQNRDVIALNLYADFVENGVLQHDAVIVSDNLGTSSPHIPGISISDRWLEMGWQINIVLPTPGSGSDIPQMGVSTAIEAKATKPGSTMTHTLQRVTSLTQNFGGSGTYYQVLT